MLTALTLLALASDPVPPSRPSHRIEICGRLLVKKPTLRLLPRTGPAFSPFVRAPDAFEEPRARPRSSAELTCTPALCDDGASFERTHTFRRYERPDPASPVRRSRRGR